MNTGSTGNVRQRGGDATLITPTRVTAGRVCEADLVRITRAGDVQSSVAPSSAWAMHAAIYAAHSRAQANAGR